MKSVDVNVDKTIEQLLVAYAEYMKTLLAREEHQIARIRKPDEKKSAQEKYNNAVESHKYLQLVADDPKKYLYFPRTIEYIGVDKDGMPGKMLGVFSTADSVDHRLEPIMALENKYCERVLYPLSQNIANHVSVTPEEETMTSEGKVWAYYGHYSCDINAENILELNKYVRRLNSKPFISFFQQFANPAFFAAPLYPKHER